jgi:pimeloyl-ACP methyl ester carboxylesterase/cold shock CspA family protein
MHLRGIRQRQHTRAKALTLLIVGFLLFQSLGILIGSSGSVRASVVGTTGNTTRVSVDSSGNQGNHDSWYPAMSADGQIVAFTSVSGNLVSNDTNGTSDVFVHDRSTGETTRISVDSIGSQGDYWSHGHSISADGRIVTFSSPNRFVPHDTNGREDVYVHDRTTAQTTRVSVGPDGNDGNKESYAPSISGDGRIITFASRADNLVLNDTNNVPDIFVHDRLTGQTARISVDSSGSEGDNSSEYSWVSGDGRIVAFQSLAGNLVPDDTNGMDDIFIHDRTTGQTTRVSVSTGGIQGNGYSRNGSISADGESVAFISVASNLVSNDTNDRYDVFVHDRPIGRTTRVSVGSSGGEGKGWSAYATPGYAALSADGQVVVFSSGASNLVPDDTNGSEDVFVHDRTNGQTSRVSIGSSGNEADSWSHTRSISADGQIIAFWSGASNLVPDDTNAAEDVFVHNRSSVTEPTIDLSASRVKQSWRTCDTTRIGIGLTVTNDGTAASGIFQVRIRLTEGGTLVNQTKSTRASLAAGAASTFTLGLPLPDTGPRTLTATATVISDADTVTTNNRARATLSIKACDPFEVSAVSPSAGNTGGGTSVTLTGKGFLGATSVLFGTIEAPILGPSSDTSIQVVSPVGVAGPVPVTVVKNGRTTPANAAATFTYRQRVVVLLEGQNTNLTRSVVTGNDGSNGFYRVMEGAVVYTGIVPYLKSHSWDDAVFLGYSYRGGAMQDGNWKPKTYACQDTFLNRILEDGLFRQSDVTHLRNQLRDYATAKPYSEFHLLGHSQGGLVALAYLAYIDANPEEQVLPNSSVLSSVITIDSPLGGTQVDAAWGYLSEAGLRAMCPGMVEVVSFTRPFRNLADMRTIWSTSSGTPHGGTRKVQKLIAESEGKTNQQVVEDAARRGVRILTAGNINDTVFSPCLPGEINAPTTQFVKPDKTGLAIYVQKIAAGSTCTGLDFTNHSIALYNSTVKDSILRVLNGQNP